MGVAAGDFDNDGCVDLYLTASDRNPLFRNSGDGTFTDVVQCSRHRRSGWSVSASFVDFDRDGWLDLYVGNYVTCPAEHQHAVRHAVGRPDYCSPQRLSARAEPALSQQRRTARSPTSRAAAASRASSAPRSASSTADFNGDGWIDIYVANDGEANQLWMNQRNGTFRNTGCFPARR